MRIGRADPSHRWNRKPRTPTSNISNLVFLMEFSQSSIFLNGLSGALVGVGGSDFVGYLGEAQVQRPSNARGQPVLVLVLVLVVVLLV